MKPAAMIRQYSFFALFGWLAVLGIPHAAYAEDGCTAVAVADAWPINDPKHIYSDDTPKGQTVLTDAFIDTATPDGKPLTYAEPGGTSTQRRISKSQIATLARLWTIPRPTSGIGPWS